MSMRLWMCFQSVHVRCYTYKRSMPNSVYLWSDAASCAAVKHYGNHVELDHDPSNIIILC